MTGSLSIFEDVYVLKNDAVVSDGPDKIVYVRKGDRYEPAKVVVLYSDDEFVVLDKASQLNAYDTVVTSGAYGLDIALKAGTAGAVGAHAGHSH